MKKILSLGFVLLVSLSACKKDEVEKPGSTQTAYAQRLEGDWELIAVKYDGTVPLPTGPIDVKGNGTDVSGGHTITSNPNKIDFNYSFTAQVMFSGFPVPVPIEQQGKGDWTLSESEDMIFISEDGETVAWTVLVNEAKKQVYAARITQEASGFAVVFDVEFTFTK